MRLIDADALLEKMKHRKEYVSRPSDPICLVEDAPTVGGWINVEDEKPEIGQMCFIWDGKSVKSGIHLMCGVWSVSNKLEYPEFWMPLLLEPPEEDEDETD